MFSWIEPLPISSFCAAACESERTNWADRLLNSLRADILNVKKELDEEYGTLPLSTPAAFEELRNIIDELQSSVQRTAAVLESFTETKTAEAIMKVPAADSKQSHEEQTAHLKAENVAVKQALADLQVEYDALKTRMQMAMECLLPTASPQVTVAASSNPSDPCGSQSSIRHCGHQATTTEIRRHRVSPDIMP
jgi:seryl-tRNA synthetase